MAYVPPWLNIEPSQFVQAAAAGGRLGAQLAQIASERAASSERNATQLSEAQMRNATEQQLGSQRLSAEQQQQQAANALRQWEIQQQMAHNQSVIDAENQRNQATIGAENTRAANALTEKQNYGNKMIDIREEANRIAQERADAAKDKPNASDYETVTEHTKEVAPSKSYYVTKPEIFNLFKANTPGSSMTTTNVADLQNLPRGSSIVTNTIPGTGAPARTFSRRVPIGQDPYALPLGGATTPVNPLEGKRVRHKDTGQTGVITNGVFVPDQTPHETGASEAD